VSAWEIFFTTVGMALITLVCRSFFLLPEQDLPMPQWLREGLRYAPIAALAAVVAPELVMTQGHLIDTWRDARIFGALAGLAFYAWRRSLFGTIVCGTGVMLALRFGLGW
jgi:branched-subunit amino acid transport protein